MRDVSVIIPAFNAGKFLAEALESILLQTTPPDEIIVVDDGSVDNTKDVISSFPGVIYVYKKNEGTASAVNTGVSHAQGKVFAFLDADDLWLPEKLERQYLVMDSDQSIEMVFTMISNFLSEDLDPALKETIEFKDNPMSGIHKSTLMITREAFFKVGLFSTHSGIDLLDWYARSKEKTIKEFVINEVLVRRRIHDSNQWLKSPDMKQDFPRAIKLMLDRRRSNGELS